MSNTLEATFGNSGAAALNAPVWTLVRLAQIVAEAYEAIENPDDRGTMAAAAEWFPKIEAALAQAGLR